MIRTLQKRGSALGWLSIALSLLVASTTTAALGQPAAAPKDPKTLAEAKKHWEAGQDFYNDPTGHKCEEAVIEFSKAYDLSGSVKAVRARGICELELEKDGAAIADFEIYLASPPKDADPSEVAQVKSDTNKLKAIVADLAITTDKPNTKITAVRTPAQGLPITNRYLVPATGLTLKIHPGAYTFTASADGMPDVTWSGELSNGSQSQHAIDFEAAKKAAEDAKAKGLPPPGGGTPDPGTRPIPVTAYIFGGVTIACLAPTIAFGVLGIQAKSKYDEQNGHATRAVLEDLKSDVVTKSLVSDVFLGVTIAAAVTTTIFIVTRPTVHKTTDSKPKTAWTVVPSFSVKPDAESHRDAVDAGAFVIGSF